MCTYCGSRAGILEYHHRRPSEKRFTLGGKFECGRDSSEIQSEIAKCDLTCGPCHRAIHRAARVAYGLPNGEDLLKQLRDSQFKPIHVDAALTLLRDMNAHPAVVAKLVGHYRR